MSTDTSDGASNDDIPSGRGVKRIPSDGSLDERSTSFRCTEESSFDDDNALDLLLDFDVVSEWSLKYLHEYLSIPTPASKCIAKPCITVR